MKNRPNRHPVPAWIECHQRRLFHALFATTDQKEGMDAFVNKRPPTFTNS